MDRPVRGGLFVEWSHILKQVRLATSTVVASTPCILIHVEQYMQKNTPINRTQHVFRPASETKIMERYRKYR